MHQLIFVNGSGTPESDSNDDTLIEAIVASFTVAVVITVWVILVILIGVLIHNYA